MQYTNTTRPVYITKHISVVVSGEASPLSTKIDQWILDLIIRDIKPFEERNKRPKEERNVSDDRCLLH